jgi:Fur family peroxide stress response transcriptional regulator
MCLMRKKAPVTQNMELLKEKPFSVNRKVAKPEKCWACFGVDTQLQMVYCFSMDSVDCTKEQLELLERKCRESGVPLTSQRRQVFVELARRKDHPTADQLFESLQGKDADLSRTTVYRALEALGQLGLAKRVPTPAACARFDADMRQHDHFFCIACGRVTDLQQALGRSFDHPVLLADGSLALGATTTMTGHCKNCRQEV